MFHGATTKENKSHTYTFKSATFAVNITRDNDMNMHTTFILQSLATSHLYRGASLKSLKDHIETLFEGLSNSDQETVLSANKLAKNTDAKIHQLSVEYIEEMSKRALTAKTWSKQQDYLGHAERVLSYLPVKLQKAHSKFSSPLPNLPMPKRIAQVETVEDATRRSASNLEKLRKTHY
jgi:hypothetical protein